MYAEIWTYRTGLRPNLAGLKGFKVEATDGSIGRIDEATDEIGGSAIVVDTGPWIFGRKVVLPAGTIERVNAEQEKVFVGMTKEQIKMSPEFDEARGWRTEEYKNDLASYYATKYRWAS